MQVQVQVRVQCAVLESAVQLSLVKSQETRVKSQEGASGAGGHVIFIAAFPSA